MGDTSIERHLEQGADGRKLSEGLRLYYDAMEASNDHFVNAQRQEMEMKLTKVLGDAQAAKQVTAGALALYPPVGQYTNFQWLQRNLIDNGLKGQTAADMLRIINQLTSK